MKLETFLKKKAYQSIALKSLPSGHYVIKARLNKQKGTFILDTGASTTCVSEDKIKYFKLKAKETEHKATGAGTMEIDIRLAKKNRLQIGKWKIKKVPVVIMDLGHINQALSIFDVKVDGIIGADILHEGKGIIQYEKNLLFLK